MIDSLTAQTIDAKAEKYPERFYANGEFVWDGTDWADPLSRLIEVKETKLTDDEKQEVEKIVMSKVGNLIFSNPQAVERCRAEETYAAKNRKHDRLMKARSEARYAEAEKLAQEREEEKARALAKAVERFEAREESPEVKAERYKAQIMATKDRDERQRLMAEFVEFFD